MRSRAAPVLPIQERFPLPKSKLTDAVVAKATLPEGRKEAVLWDSEVTGFGLRLRAASQTWIVYYRPAGAGRTAAAKAHPLVASPLGSVSSSLISQDRGRFVTSG